MRDYSKYDVIVKQWADSTNKAENRIQSHLVNHKLTETWARERCRKTTAAAKIHFVAWQLYSFISKPTAWVMLTALLQQRTEGGITNYYEAWYPVSADEGAAAAGGGTPPPNEP